MTNPEGEDAFEVIGNNVLTNKQEYGLCSYNGEYSQIIYDRENNINDIEVNAVAANIYLKQASALMCGGIVRTALPAEQQIRGNYGMIFELAFENSVGDINIKKYIVDVNQFQGNPYKLNFDSKQYGIFEIDGTNFKYINKISLFVSNFPNQADDKPNDIFIKDLELEGVEKLSSEALGSYSLSFITPQGTYFDNTHLDTDKKVIQAQVRIKGKAIDNDSQKLEYYWFIENTAITYMSEKYHRYGGPGWECINAHNVVKNAEAGTPPVIEWTPALYELTIEKKDILGKERKYKCVAVYNSENILSREITITNFSSAFDLTIESNEGTQFYFDEGSPTLTCKVNGEERLTGYTYSWGKVDNNGIFSAITNANKNKIVNFYIGDIVNFVIIKCSVSYNGNFLGTAEITLLNSTEKPASTYNLVINNGTQVFKYNELGISPASGALDNPMILLPLSFTLYDSSGTVVTEEELKKAEITWSVPIVDTMLKLTDVVIPTEQTESEAIYKNIAQLNYLIKDNFDMSLRQ